MAVVGKKEPLQNDLLQKFGAINEWMARTSHTFMAPIFQTKVNIFKIIWRYDKRDRKRCITLSCATFKTLHKCSFLCVTHTAGVEVLALL